MTQWRIEEISCPECGQVQTVDIWDSINVTHDPQLREKLFKNEINVFLCDHCGAFYDSLLDWLYHDMEKKIMIFVQHSDRNLREEMKESEKWYPPELLEGRKTRIVHERNHLIEKINIFENGLDDRVIEALKIVLWVKMNRDGFEVNANEFLFAGFDENGELVFYFFTADGQDMHTKAPDRLYQSFLNGFKSQPAWEEDIDSDWLTIDMNYVRERFDASLIEPHGD